MNFALMLNFINCRKDSVRKLNTLYKVSLLSFTDAVQVEVSSLRRSFFLFAFLFNRKEKESWVFCETGNLLLAPRHHDEKSKLSGCAPEAILCIFQEDDEETFTERLWICSAKINNDRLILRWRRDLISETFSRLTWDYRDYGDYTAAHSIDRFPWIFHDIFSHRSGQTIY